MFWNLDVTSNCLLFSERIWVLLKGFYGQKVGWKYLKSVLKIVLFWVNLINSIFLALFLVTFFSSFLRTQKRASGLYMWMSVWICLPTWWGMEKWWNKSDPSFQMALYLTLPRKSFLSTSICDTEMKSLFKNISKLYKVQWIALLSIDTTPWYQ